ncbi:MAG: outer membrane beta-barrel protein [Cyclobacteriaceae bacterium]
MKKNLLLVILFLCGYAFEAISQNETHIGIKVGITSANINGSDVNQLSNNGNPSALQGLNLGIFVNSKTKRNFWIKSELIYIQKGSVLNYKDGSGNSLHSNLKSSYIDLYPFSPTFHWKGLQVLAGPYVSMLLSSSIQDSTTFGHPSWLTTYRQKLDAGFVLGLEYESKWGISIGARYTKGYIPLYEKPGNLVTNPSTTPSIQNIYNESISISIGYSFGRHKSEKKLY